MDKFSPIILVEKSLGITNASLASAENKLTKRNKNNK
jgi:hypothetical protein